MSRKNTDEFDNGEQPEEEAAPSEPQTYSVVDPGGRPAPKRKFEVWIGAMNFAKRCTVEEMQQTIAETDGVRAFLEIDGARFEFADEH